jgi:hypothetical protein
MTKLNKYYEEILRKVDKFIAEKNYDEAFELVSQEIASPYIPMEYVERFEQLYVEINKIVMVNQIKHKYNNMSKMEMLGKIYDGKKVDLNLLSFFLGKFHKQIEPMDLQYLNKIFMDKTITNTEKIFALEQIKITEIHYIFDYNNGFINKIFTINTNSDFEFHKHSYFVQTQKLIEDILIKDPSLATLAHELLLIIYEYYFGTQPYFESVVLADKLTRYVKAYFDNKYKPDVEFKI